METGRIDLRAIVPLYQAAYKPGSTDTTRMTMTSRYWRRLDDEEVIAGLTQGKDVGRWTTQMFLIFRLRRPDVLPVADQGLQRTIGLHYSRGRPVREARLRRLADHWAPWRTAGTWHLCRSLDPVTLGY